MGKVVTLEQSVQGANHKSKTPPVDCQDKSLVCHLEDGTIVVAVADGHGSNKCRFSKIGAELAVKTFCEVIDVTFAKYKKDSDGDREKFIKLLRQIDDGRLIKTVHTIWKKRIQKSFDEIKGNYDDLKDTVDVDPELYGTTLMGLVVSIDFVYAVQVGDGDIAYVDDGGFRHVIEPDKFLGTETYSLCSDKPWENSISYFQRACFLEKIPCLFIVTTDGFSNSFIDDEQYHVACQDYFRTICDYGDDEVQNNLESWLNQTSESGCGDDITFVAVGVIDEECIKSTDSSDTSQDEENVDTVEDDISEVCTEETSINDEISQEVSEELDN